MGLEPTTFKLQVEVQHASLLRYEGFPFTIKKILSFFILFTSKQYYRFLFYPKLLLLVGWNVNITAKFKVHVNMWLYSAAKQF